MAEVTNPPQDSCDITPGEQKIMEFFNELELNEPVSLHEITEGTGLSWTFVKQVITSQKFTIETKKSGKTWIAWKTFDRVAIRHDDTCQKYLREE